VQIGQGRGAANEIAWDEVNSARRGDFQPSYAQVSETRGKSGETGEMRVIVLITQRSLSCSRRRLVSS